MRSVATKRDAVELNRGQPRRLKQKVDLARACGSVLGRQDDPLRGRPFGLDRLRSLLHSVAMIDGPQCRLRLPCPKGVPPAWTCRWRRRSSPARSRQIDRPIRRFFVVQPDQRNLILL